VGSAVLGQAALGRRVKRRASLPHSSQPLLPSTAWPWRARVTLPPLASPIQPAVAAPAFQASVKPVAPAPALPAMSMRGIVEPDRASSTLRGGALAAPAMRAASSKG